VKTFKNLTLKKFLDELSQKSPVPGGGSVAALCAAQAAGLLCMVANYSLGRCSGRRVEARLTKVLDQSRDLRDRFLALADEDAKAYLNVVDARGKGPRVVRAAKRGAAAVPRQTARLCRKAMDLTDVLVNDGNPYLLSDVEVAVELLFAAYKSAMINVRVNQEAA